MDSGKCFWILGSVFGFWEVFLDSGTCFGFWEVFVDSGKCFWILGSVLESGKCFVLTSHRSFALSSSGVIRTLPRYLRFVRRSSPAPRKVLVLSLRLP